MACLSDNEVVALLAGQLDPEERDRVLGHIDGCAGCRTLVAQVGQEDGAEPLAPGSLLGRYVILGLLGAGAMGVVYAAHDPSLDRKIAIKLLRPDTGEDRETMAERLLREARVLARLAHPNVVVLHDVGRRDDEVFLAMELVEGGTLRRWLADAGRPWREVLRMFLQAGEGLAAAHENGIVHRDFKPDNVLVGRDGRARVTDFGLARGAVDLQAPEALPPALRQRAASLLSRTGALIGTPAYMAPEQLAGKPATPLSDQYAFCVALHEALSGARPGDEGARPAGSRIPAVIQGALQRGLQARPEARWPDMRELLGRLGRAEKLASPWRWAALVVLSLAAATTSYVAWWRARAIQPCSSPFDAASEGWDPQAQGRVRQAFLAAMGADGGGVFEAVRRRFERQAGELGELRREACRSFRVRQEISPVHFEQRSLCLDRRRGELASLIELFSRADRQLAENAPQIVSSLPDVAACRQFEALSRRPPLPADPVLRGRILALDERLTQADTWALAWVQQQQAEEIAADVLAQSASLGWRHLETRALLTLAKTDGALHSPLQSDRRASEAAAAALASHDDEVLADAWLLRIDIASTLGHIDQAEDHGRLARGAIQRLGNDPLREAARLGGLCRAHERASRDLDHARSLCEAARDLLLRERPGEIFLLATVEERLGNVLLRQEQFAEAEKQYRSAIQKRQTILPASSQILGNTRSNLAEALTMQGRYAEALEIFEDVLRRCPWWHIFDGLALTQWRMGDRAQARATQQRAFDTCVEASRGGLCDALASIRLGEYQLETGQPREARASLDHALTLRGAVQLPPYEEARAHLLLARLEPAQAPALRDKARSLLEPVAHRGGAHLALLQAARQPDRPLPPL